MFFIILSIRNKYSTYKKEERKYYFFHELIYVKIKLLKV